MKPERPADPPSDDETSTDSEIRRLDKEGHLFHWNNVEEALTERRVADLLKEPMETGRPRALKGSYKGAFFVIVAYVTTDEQKADDFRRNLRVASESYLGRNPATAGRGE